MGDLAVDYVTLQTILHNQLGAYNRAVRQQRHNDDEILNLTSREHKPIGLGILNRLLNTTYCVSVMTTRFV